MLQKLLRIFGMPPPSVEEFVLEELEALLRRERPVNTIAAMLNAIQCPSAPVSLDRAALCLDTNVFFQLSNMGERVQIVDYLSAKHTELLVVSAQAIQEVWNGYLNGIDTVATDIRNKLDALSKAVAPIDQGFGEYKERFDALLSEFKDDFGHLHQEGLKERIRGLIELLQRRATFCEVPRQRFEVYYSSRKLTKTPPGFKDDGAGDYFIWLDFLFGLRLAKQGGAAFDKAVLVSADRKIDWVRGGAAHPTLVQECLDFVGVPLEIWNLKRLAEATRNVS